MKSGDVAMRCVMRALFAVVCVRCACVSCGAVLTLIFFVFPRLVLRELLCGLNKKILTNWVILEVFYSTRYIILADLMGSRVSS
jgi:hypothetical protein